MSELTPITRIEDYLDAIVNSGTPPLEDITRIETFLQAIYDNQVCALTPITRIEMFLGKISGQDVTPPEPVTRIEMYLAAIAGEDVELPEMPITRLEMYLAEWADSGDWTTISGAIVEFITQRAHKLKSCVVNLSPKQDLHGYDAPWPEGGRNVIRPTPRTVTSKGVTYTANVDGSITLTGTATGDENFTVVSGDAGEFPTPLSILVTGGPSTGISFGIGGVLVSVNNGTYTFTSAIQKNTTSIRVASGTVTNYTIKIQAENSSTIPTQWYPYSNICPISGWTGVSVWNTGHNVWDEEWEFGVYNAQGQPSPSNAQIRTKNHIPVKPSTSYAFIRPVGVFYIFWYDSSDAFISQDFRSVGSNGYVVVVSPEGAAYLRFYVWQTSYGNNMGVNYPSTDHEYHAYNGNSYSVTFGETVYGATPDIVSGEMPATKNLITIGSLSWDYYNGVFYANITGKANNNASTNIICSVYAQGSRNATGAGDAASILQDKQITGFYDPNSANSWVYVKDSAYATALAFKTAMGDQTICYELATPITIQLSPQQITALKGYNAMWADAGDIEVTVHGTPVEVETLQALNMLLGGAYHNNQTADDVSDEEALDIILGGEQR